MVQPSPTPFDVGRAFVHQYYTLLHQAPHMLHRFYSTDSTFIHGGVDRPGCVEQPAVGPDSISQRINDLNLRDCHAKIRQVDSHPTIGDGVVVQVTGELSNNGDPMRRFMQTFVLAPRQPKKYYVQNDIFRYQDEVFDDASDEVDEDDRSSSHIYGDTISNADKTSNADSSAAVANTQQTLLVAAATRSHTDEHQALPPRGNGTTLGGNQQQITSAQAVRQQEHPNTGASNLNGFSNANVNESTNFGGINHTHNQQQETAQSHRQPSPKPVNYQITQENQHQTNGTTNLSNQQQVKQSSSIGTTESGVRSEGTSYAGIAKLHSSVGTISNTNTSVAGNTRNGQASSTAPLANSQQANSVRPLSKGPSTTSTKPTNAAQSGQQRNNNNYYSQNNRGNYWNENSQQDHSPGRRSGTTVATAPNEQQVFVGSLPLEFNEEILIKFFSQYGTVLDAKIHKPLHDNKKNFGFIVFDDPAVASGVVKMEHIAYNDKIRLNVEPKTQRNFTANNNSGGNFNNGQQGAGRNNNYQTRGGGRGGSRATYRGGANQRRGGGSSHFNNNINSPSFNGGDENSNDYRNKGQQPLQQQ